MQVLPLAIAHLVAGSIPEACIACMRSISEDVSCCKTCAAHGKLEMASNTLHKTLPPTSTIALGH